MDTVFRIPRQSDRELISALGRVRKAVQPIIALNFLVRLPYGSDITIKDDQPENAPELKYAFDKGLEVIGYIFLNSQGQTLVQVHRTLNEVTDTVTLLEGPWNNLQNPNKSQAWIAILSGLRKELKASDVEAAFKGQTDNAWNRYRDAQMAVVNSLQQTAETLLLRVADKNAELDRERAARFEKLETDLRAELADHRKMLAGEYQTKSEDLARREKTFKDRVAEFDTKESRYVVRQKQGEQIKQIQEWLNDWHLTKGTREKRTPIFYGYIVALVFFGGLTVVATYLSFDFLESVGDLTKLQWWHWAAIISKSFFPLAAFTTFMIYFIKWSSAWAREHSEEEFQNRTRLIDIGRASWLLEAVHDAQERNKEIPADLLKELSNNLFTSSARLDGDVQPETAADILLQGLSSLRVKSPTGAEVEAKRGK